MPSLQIPSGILSFNTFKLSDFHDNFRLLGPEFPVCGILYTYSTYLGKAQLSKTDDFLEIVGNHLNEV